MTLGVLIGNTNIKIGYMQGDTLMSHSYPKNTHDFSDLNHLPVSKILLASVVPDLVAPVSESLDGLFGVPAHVIEKEAVPINLSRYDTRNIGIDRVLSCYGGFDVSGAFVVFDLGTAISVSVVNGGVANDSVANSERFFCGGAILPGVEMGLKALGNGTALLPSLDISQVSDSPVIGADTQACLISGAIHGTTAIVEGLAKRMERELGEPLQILLTGGFAPYIIDHAPTSWLHRPNLTMAGLLRLG